MVKCERNYRRNHLRWYRITCIKRSSRGRKKSGEEERRRSAQEAGTNEQARIPPGNACKATSFLVSSPTISLPILLFLSLSLSCSSFLSSPAIFFLFYRANAFIFGHWSQSLANELTAGCENLTWSICDLDLWLRCHRRRRSCRVIVYFLLLLLRSLFLRARFLRHLPACSMIIEPAGPPLLVLLVQQREQRDLYLQNRSTR